MTEFQSKCMAAIAAELEGLKTDNKTFHRRGRGEPYFFLGTVVRNHPVRFYVYPNEAEFVIDNDVSAVCERADHPSDEELIASLVKLLDAYSRAPTPTMPRSAGLADARGTNLWKSCWRLRVLLREKSLFPFLVSMGGVTWLFVESWTANSREKGIGCGALLFAGSLHFILRKPFSRAIVEHAAKYEASPLGRGLGSYKYALSLVTWSSSLMFLFGGALLMQIAMSHAQ